MTGDSTKLAFEALLFIIDILLINLFCIHSTVSHRLGSIGIVPAAAVCRTLHTNTLSRIHYHLITNILKSIFKADS